MNGNICIIAAIVVLLDGQIEELLSSQPEYFFIETLFGFDCLTVHICNFGNPSLCEIIKKLIEIFKLKNYYHIHLYIYVTFYHCSIENTTLEVSLEVMKHATWFKKLKRNT